jgi:hypothetical protein
MDDWMDGQMNRGRKKRSNKALRELYLSHEVRARNNLLSSYI